MPPKVTMKPSTKCLKFGEILMDENRRFMFLCVQCFLDFTGLQEFRDHLKNCSRVRHIFKASTSTKLNCENGTKILKKITKDSKEELIVYGFDENHSSGKRAKKNGDLTDLLSIEAELLDPRWYTDAGANSEAETKNKSSYIDLIEEVTPFVHFKENVKANPRSRVTRINGKQTVKEHQGSSGESVVKNKQKTVSPMSPNVKPRLSNDKKQIPRHAVQQKPISMELANKPSISQSRTEATKNIANKPKPKTATKAAAVMDTTKNENQKINPANVEKESLKRKAESFPLPKDKSNSESDQTVKRRRTQIHQLKTSSSPKPTPMVTSKPNETSPKPPSSSKRAQNTPAEWLPSQNAIISSKKDNTTDSNTKKPPQRKRRSEVLNNKPQPPPKQVQPQIVLQVNANQSQPTTAYASTSKINDQPLVPNQSKKIQIKEMPQAIPRVTHSAPAATSTPIISKVASYHVQETRCPLTNNNQKTEEILNKLQTLGLKVQRTNPIPEQKSIVAATNSNEQALEIIKKLQLKGMNVKIVQNPNTATKIQPLTPIYNPGQSFQANIGNTNSSMPPFAMTKRTGLIANTVLASKTNFSKNVLIKKCT